MSFDLLGFFPVLLSPYFHLLPVQLQVNLLFIIYVMKTGKQTWQPRFSICLILTCFAIWHVVYFTDLVIP